MQTKYIPDPSKFPIFRKITSTTTKLHLRDASLSRWIRAWDRFVESRDVTFWSALDYGDAIEQYGGRWLESGIREIPTRPPFDIMWIESNFQRGQSSFAMSLVGHETDDEGYKCSGLFYLKTPNGNGDVFIGPGSYWISFDQNGFVVDWGAGFDTDEQVEMYETLYNTLIVTVLIGFAFSHCKNVEIVDRLPSRQVKRSMMRRGESPVKYSEVAIKPSHSVTRGVSGGNTSDKPHKALHIARGHFATYTEDAPLFGKYVGTFWRPAHVRGSAEVGTVYKDYKVKP